MFEFYTCRCTLCSCLHTDKYTIYMIFFILIINIHIYIHMYIVQIFACVGLNLELRGLQFRVQLREVKRFGV